MRHGRMGRPRAAEHTAGAAALPALPPEPVRSALASAALAQARPAAPAPRRAADSGEVKPGDLDEYYGFHRAAARPARCASSAFRRCASSCASRCSIAQRHRLGYHQRKQEDHDRRTAAGHQGVPGEARRRASTTTTATCTIPTCRSPTGRMTGATYLCRTRPTAALRASVAT